MIGRFFSKLRGTIVALLLLINIVLFGAFICVFCGLVLLLLPKQKWRHSYVKYFQHLTVPPWTVVNNIILALSNFRKWQVNKSTKLNPNDQYLLISNHQNWVDILVLLYAFNYKLPIIKFFMKKELLWQLPLGGLACYILGFPFLSRHSRDDIRKNPKLKGKDIETAKNACTKSKVVPCTIVNCVEGTRFSQAKKSKQKSPYHYLLKPKTAGAAIVINEMRGHLKGVLNATIYYRPQQLSFFDILCGKIEQIQIDYEVIPITDDLYGDYYNDRTYRKRLTSWLSELWQQKDKQLIAFHDDQ